MLSIYFNHSSDSLYSSITLSPVIAVMADRVHPIRSPPAADTKNQEPTDGTTTTTAGYPESQQKPKSGTYVIQIPKDQIYRVPPPHNARLLETYRRRGSRRRRSPCCRCLIWSVCALAVLALALAIASGVLYFVFRPKLPSYSLNKIAVKGFNFNQTILSPEIDVSVRADNPNKKISIKYGGGSDVSASYSDVILCRGSWPVFDQGRRNVTVFETRLRGSGIRLSGSLKNQLLDRERRREVPLVINVKVPVKIKFGAVTSWKINVKVRCDVVVDRLTENARIVSKKCRTRVGF